MILNLHYEITALGERMLTNQKRTKLPFLVLLIIFYVLLRKPVVVAQAQPLPEGPDEYWDPVAEKWVQVPTPVPWKSK